MSGEHGGRFTPRRRLSSALEQRESGDLRTPAQCGSVEALTRVPCACAARGAQIAESSLPPPCEATAPTTAPTTTAVLADGGLAPVSSPAAPESEVELRGRLRALREAMWRGQASAKARWHLAQVGCNDASALMPLLSRDARLARCATDGGVGLLPLLLIDIGSNLGGFLEEAAHALGDLDSRLEQNSKVTPPPPPHSPTHPLPPTLLPAQGERVPLPLRITSRAS
ncbi:hypothetical protein T492DRAFT_1117064 [Pavlovales sp. CCMP2436]|nr:hypothetical protein T492DRAFT_1117064 [Pavlovales sp. CCMP2436]